MLYRKIDNQLQQTCDPLLQILRIYYVSNVPLHVCVEGKPFTIGAVTSPRNAVPYGRGEPHRAAIPFVPPTANTFRV